MTPQLFDSVDAYNAGHPASPFPADRHTRHVLRGYRAALQGVTDDLTGTGSGASLTVDFLPGGAPLPHEADRVGTVVASRWGEGPVLVLAENVSLRAAWRAVTDAWPTHLSGVHTALDALVGAEA
ncbi:hypothetical protein [Saccharomonospora piscinae]|uniref:Uncharacterized protein n=1 Tax=Saccharomonospora piscinae TaxID=687388 RepID=A0A1V9A168_SACPI|nr:hypothetical protein [Saccharomonospora piscinae]OQO90895.1 hypothetical protein B1813_15370 [Saccharomonospora piscinae]TLW93584.1 hypothetical protein FFT09_09410 [Saccharomonospora piscinae]